jgi:hypothetical protein
MGVHVVAPLGFGKIIYYGVTIIVDLYIALNPVRKKQGQPASDGTCSAMTNLFKDAQGYLRMLSSLPNFALLGGGARQTFMGQAHQ